MEAFEAWNRLAADTGLPKAQKLDEGRRRAIAVRLRENAGIAGWNRALREIRGSPFLLGRERLRDGECRWNASLDWLTKPSNFRKVLDGNYAPKSRLSRGEETARAIYDALVPDAMPPPDASDPDAITLQHSEWFHEH